MDVKTKTPQLLTYLPPPSFSLILILLSVAHPGGAEAETAAQLLHRDQNVGSSITVETHREGPVREMVLKVPVPRIYEGLL